MNKEHEYKKLQKAKGNSQFVYDVSLDDLNSIPNFRNEE